MPRRKKQSSSNPFGLVLLVAVLCIGGTYAYLNWDRLPQPPNPDVIDGADDKRVIPSLKGAWVVVVVDRKGVTTEKQLTLDDTDFWNGLAEKGLRWRIIDPTEDADTAKPFMNKSPVPPPFVMLVTKAGDRIKSIPLPDNDTKPIEGMLNGK